MPRLVAIGTIMWVGERKQGAGMPFANLVRWSGLAAMVGGALWVVIFVLFALRPSGPGLEPAARRVGGGVCRPRPPSGGAGWPPWWVAPCGWSYSYCSH